MLSAWTVAVSVFSRELPNEMVARVLGVMGLISTGFLLFMLLTSNPFERLLPPAPDGRDLNPLLQDPGMVIHPPMLYMGYSVSRWPFLRDRALLGGKLDATWALGAALDDTRLVLSHLRHRLAAGGRAELGWGGWWFGTRSRTRRSCRGSSAPRWSFARRDRSAAPSGLDGAAGDARFQHEPPRHLPRALAAFHVCTFATDQSAAFSLRFSRSSSAARWLRLARAPWGPSSASRVFARIHAARKQCCSWSPRARFCWAALSPRPGRAQPGQDRSDRRISRAVFVPLMALAVFRWA
jgi:hypothetical protein